MPWRCLLTRNGSFGRGGPPRARTVILVSLVLVAVFGAFLWVLWPSDRPRGLVQMPETPPAKAPGAPFVGNQVCRECHPINASQHRRSGHSHTLRLASETDLARWLDGRRAPDPESQQVQWAYSLHHGQLFADRIDRGRKTRALLEYAFGSGRHATTFVTLHDPSGGPTGSREHRLTYFAASKSLGLTPAQDALEGEVPGLNPMGRDRDPGETVHCFGCHSTVVSAFSPDYLHVPTMRPNIGCERCHGPGASHVEAVRRGDDDVSMPFGKVWTAEGQMKLCGDCHRHPSQAPPGQIRPDNPVIVRFQPVGLMQSACYRKSDGGLSCTNCHNPHDRPSSDPAFYESACLSCHGGEEQTHCPVSPGQDCLECHMPRLDSGQGVLYTDHWIRVRKPKK